MHKSVIDNIINEYYIEILKYCHKHLHGDMHGAQDCTQEVFLRLHQKINSLNMRLDIRPWLYRTADRVIKEYLRHNPEVEDVDAIPEIADTTQDEDESPLNCLTGEERMLVDDYYSGRDKEKLAAEKGITLKSLYVRICRIRKKLLSELDKSNRL